MYWISTLLYRGPQCQRQNLCVVMDVYVCRALREVSSISLSSISLPVWFESIVICIECVGGGTRTYVHYATLSLGPYLIRTCTRIWRLQAIVSVNKILKYWDGGSMCHIKWNDYSSKHLLPSFRGRLYSAQSWVYWKWATLIWHACTCTHMYIRTYICTCTYTCIYIEIFQHWNF